MVAWVYHAHAHAYSRGTWLGEDLNVLFGVTLDREVFAAEEVDEVRGHVLPASVVT